MNKILQKSILSIGLCLSMSIYAQDEDCSSKLRQAQKVYDDGVLEAVEPLLSQCIEGEGFTKSELVDAHKLLMLVGLFEDNFAMAEKNMTALLKANPDFVPKASDPFELKDLYDKFRTDPVFTIGLKVGLNIGYATMSEYSSVGATDNSEINFVDGYNGTGFQAGLSYNHRINKGLYVNFDPRILIINHRMEEIVGADSTILVIKNEANSLLSGDFGLSYDFRYRQPFKIYIEAGISGSYLLRSSTRMEKRYNDGSGLSVQESEVDLLGTSSNSDYEFPENRQRTMLGFYYGAGIKYKLGNGHFLFGIRHLIGQSNITADRYNPALYGKYDYVLKDISLNSVMFNIGYVQSIYMPKILKRNLKND